MTPLPAPLKGSRSITKWLMLLSLVSFRVFAVEDFTFFNERILPILTNSCYECHSSASQKLKGGLHLDTREGLLKGGDTGPALIPGKVAESLLIRAVRYVEEDLQMPPKNKKLSAGAIADLEKWVAMGAPDPRVGAAARPAIADLETARKLWAYRKPLAPKLPTVKNTAWPQGGIDRFILEKLEAKKLEPASPTDKRTLLRRATYDLTGLPPTPEEMTLFLADQSPTAFARVVDRLLASPHYGEHWGRHWLDVVRYTDSFDARGIGGGGDVPEAYRYRDWVVGAFNEDLPYDQFVMNQVAGDILSLREGRGFSTNGLIATGVYVLGEWGLGDADKEKMLTDVVDDQVDVTGRAFLGLTLACARCHDHKFDPISAEDYYSLAGIFFSSHILPDPGRKTEGSPVLRVPIASPEAIAHRQRVMEEISGLEKALEQSAAESVTRFASNSLPKVEQVLKILGQHRATPNAPASTLADLARRSKLPEPLLRSWADFLGLGELSPFKERVLKAANQDGVVSWRNPAGDDASATINTRTQSVMITTLTLPPRSVSLHPSPRGAVAVAWQSPISGEVKITGTVADADNQCGDGVEWLLVIKQGYSARRILEGKVENGGRSSFGTPQTTVALNKGDRVELIIAPKGGHECDTTAVDLRIVETRASGSSWDLAADLVENAETRPNPSPDRLGNADVWLLADARKQSTADELVQNSPLDAWLKANNSTARDKIATAFQQGSNGIPSIGTNLLQLLTDGKSRFWTSVRTAPEQLPEIDRRGWDEIQKKLTAARATVPGTFPVVHAMQEGGTPKSPYEGFKDTALLVRGRYDRPGAIIPRGFPKLLAGNVPSNIKEGSGRVELARWLASPENPMTARVMVNRIWQQHFGEGIVRTPNNYGKLGVPPTHPELLDYLTTEFIRSGWSVKAMHRLILLSSTYQQSSVPSHLVSQKDPENLLLGHFNRRRLGAESIRDSLLMVSGRIERNPGGPAIRDLNTRRRTLYVMTVRSDRSTYQTLFDGADPTRIVENRLSSTVAPQALFLLNHPFALEQTKHLATRAATRKGTPAEQVQWLYETLYGRPASLVEEKLGVTTLSSPNLEETLEAYCQVLLCANEFVYVD